MAKHKPSPKAAPVAPRPAEQKRPVQAVPSETAKAPADHWFMIILVAIALLINAPTINYNYTLDDPFFTTSNPLVKQGTSAIPEFFKHAAYYGVFKNHDASYRPLLLISFAIEKQIMGDFNPQVSHTVNLLLFALQIVALFLLLRRVFNTYSVYIPFFIVALFTLHPIHTEVVASVKSRDELMSLLFSALCVSRSLKYIDTDKPLHLVLSGAWMFVALMSKETSICFVAIAPLTIWFFRQADMKKIITAAVPLVLVAVLYLGMRAAFIESDGQKVVILSNNNALMAATNYGDKLATALYIQLKYIMLLVFPHPLSWDYSFNQIPIIGFGNIKALASVVVLGGLAVYGFMGLKTKNVFAYCILFYFALVALTANIIVDIGATMAERFVYAASLGFCIAIVLLVVKLLKADPSRIDPAHSSRVFGVFAVIAVLYSVKTFARNSDWKDNLTLYESGAETAPDSWRVNNLLGNEYTKMVEPEKDPAKKAELYHKAIYHLGRSIAILPSLDAYVVKGYAYSYGGQDDSAIACYKIVLATEPTNHQAVNNIGTLYMKKGMFAEAIKTLTTAVVKDSTQTDIIGNLAASYGNSGNLQEAIRYYNMALRINPKQPANVYSSLRNIYRILGDSTKSQYYQAELIQAEKEGRK